MSSPAIWTATVSRQALSVLVCLLESKRWMDPGDCFPNLSPAAARTMLTALKESLIEQGFVAVQADGSGVVDSMMHAVLRTIMAPKHALVASRTEGEAGPPPRFIYPAQGLCVEQEIHDGDRFSLTASRDTETVKQRLWEYLRIPECKPAAGAEIILSVEDLFRARHVAVRGQSCDGLLCEAGVASQSIGPLSSTLSEEPIAGSVVVLVWESEDGDRIPPLAPGMTLPWLIGSCGGWRASLFADGDVRYLRLLPSSSREMEYDLAEMMDAW